MFYNALRIGAGRSNKQLVVGLRLCSVTSSSLAWEINKKINMEMTEQEQNDFGKAMDAWDEHKRKRALKALFEKDSIGCEITDYNYFVRAFCWLKTLICLLLNRTNGSYLDTNKFCVLSYDERSSYDSTDWDACWVSPYLFKDWNVCLSSDGT